MKNKDSFQQYLDLRNWINSRPIKFKNEIKKANQNNELSSILGSGITFSGYFLDNPDKRDKESKTFKSLYNFCETIVNIDHTLVLNHMSHCNDLEPFNFIIKKGAIPRIQTVNFHMKAPGPVSEYLSNFVPKSEINIKNISMLLEDRQNKEISYGKIIPILLEKIEDKNLLLEILNQVLIQEYDSEQRRNVVNLIEKKGVKIAISLKNSELISAMGFEKNNKVLEKNNHPLQWGKYLQDGYHMGIYYDGNYFHGNIYSYYQESLINEKKIPPVKSVDILEYLISEILNNIEYI